MPDEAKPTRYAEEIFATTCRDRIRHYEEAVFDAGETIDLLQEALVDAANEIERLKADLAAKAPPEALHALARRKDATIRRQDEIIIKYEERVLKLKAAVIFACDWFERDMKGEQHDTPRHLAHCLREVKTRDKALEQAMS